MDVPAMACWLPKVWRKSRKLALGTPAELEQVHIGRVLEELDGNQTRAAKKLGISRSTLWRKMREYGLERVASEKSE